jgi:hypothetical protein
MSTDAWHVVRLEYTPDAGSFTLRIDSVANAFTGTTGSSTLGRYIWWGRVTNGGSGTFHTHYAAWGQGECEIGEMGALVPEPAALSLLVLGLGWMNRRGRRSEP